MRYRGPVLHRVEHTPQRPRDWLAQRTAGVVALGLGVLTFVVVAISQDKL